MLVLEKVEKTSGFVRGSDWSLQTTDAVDDIQLRGVFLVEQRVSRLFVSYLID